MFKFIVLYYAPDSVMKESQEHGLQEMRKVAADWIRWKEKCGMHMVDMGTPLLEPLRVSVDGTSKEGEEAAKGYSILKADNKEQIVELVKNHPHLSSSPEATIEILESIPFLPV